MAKTAVLVYVFHYDVWESIKKLLLQLTDVDFFFAFCQDNIDYKVVDQITRTFAPKSVVILENKGLDLGPFLCQIKELDETKYPFFLKIHTKQSKINIGDKPYNWCINLYNSCIGSKQVFDTNINILQNNDKIGILTNGDFILDNATNAISNRVMHLCNILQVPHDFFINTDYAAGNIFFGRTNIFKNILQSKKIDRIYSLLEYKNFALLVPNCYVQAFECTIGAMIMQQGYEIESCYEEVFVIYNAEYKTRLEVVKTYNMLCYLKDNLIVTGSIIKEYKTKLYIVWHNNNSNTVFCYKKVNDYFKRIQNDDDNSEFDPVEYKSLNIDLSTLSDEESRKHYDTHGKREGRVYNLNQITDVFDNNYYSSRYNIAKSLALVDFINKGRFEGRIYSKLIQQFNFDYGYYISYSNIITPHKQLTNQFSALKDFLINKENANNLVIKNSIKIPDKDTDTICLYLAEVYCKRDEYYVKNDIKILQNTCNNITILCNKTIKIDGTTTIVVPNKDNIDWWLQALEIGVSSINTTKNVLIMYNSDVCIYSFKDFINLFKYSNVDFLSVFDSYKLHPYDGINQYHIQFNTFIFNGVNCNLILDYIKTFAQENITSIVNKRKLFSFDFSKFLILNNKKIGAYTSNSQNLNRLYNFILKTDASDEPDISYTNKSPVTDKNKLHYFYHLIPQNYTKKKGEFKLQGWLEANVNNTVKNKARYCCIIHLYSLNGLKTFEHAIQTLHVKCAPDFFITGKKELYEKLECKNIANIQYFESENRGMDIGPFLKLLSDFYDKQITYDFIIKLQDKKTDTWRDSMVFNIIDNIEHYTLLLQNPKNSVAGPYAHLVSLDTLNRESLNKFFERYFINFPLQEEIQVNGFIGGTMFVIKHSIFNLFVKSYNIDLKYEYALLEKGAVENLFATYTHAWERIFTCIIPSETDTNLVCI